MAGGKKKQTAPPPGRSRRADLEDNRLPVEMPPLMGGEYMVSYLFEFGPGGEQGALTGQEIESWGHLLGIEWQPWQARLLLRLSRAYISELQKARARDAPPPWTDVARMWKWLQHKKAERRLDAFLK